MSRRHARPAGFWPALAAAAAALVLAVSPAPAQDTRSARNTEADASVPSGAASAPGPEITDRGVMLAVEDALLVSPAVPERLLDVDVSNGVVTLTGRVDNLLGRERAAEVAAMVRGVRSVVNRIDVRPVALGDPAVRNDVEAALAADPATQGYTVEVSVSDGVVTLDGTVDSWAERDLAGTVAAGVRGVRALDNRLAVATADPRPDVAIATEVRERLNWNAWVDAGGIEVRVADGRVTLDGAVGSAAEKTRAASLSWVAGVRDVEATGLEVAPLRAEPMQRASPPEFDEDAVRQAVRDAIIYDPRVQAADVAVHVDDSRVTLTGTVPSLQAKRAAAEDAGNTVSVWQVKNFLKVRPAARPTDSVLAEEVRRALRRDPYVNRYDISVGVEDGVVRLTGQVDGAYERVRAEDTASDVRGVIEVRNRIEAMQPWQRKSDREIAGDIRDQLFWSSLVDAGDVTVTVSDGVATLTGSVGSALAFRAAERNAFEGGARSVVNRLSIDLGGG